MLTFIICYDNEINKFINYEKMESCYNLIPFTCLNKLLTMIYRLRYELFLVGIYLENYRTALYNFCNLAFVLSALTESST